MSLRSILRPLSGRTRDLGIPYKCSRTLTSASARAPGKTKYTLHTPPRDPPPPREAPNPLVFVSAEEWSPGSSTGMELFASMFAKKGYTCLEVDIGLASLQENPPTSRALMKHFESELRRHIRLAALPFSPIIISRGAGTLVAQTYVESNPASALILIAPPLSNASLGPSPTSRSRSASTSLLPDALPEFQFEPLFPIAMMGTASQLASLSRHRLFLPPPSKIFSGIGRWMWEVDTLEVDELVGQDAFVKMEAWLDEMGF